ncbi:ATP-binding protein [Peptococcaceae bacterium 1198_IL3148]
MLIDEKRIIIENLTGVNSSKLNYYLELKKRNEEIIKQNNRLEIIHQIIKDINIDMSISDIIHRTYSKLPLVLPCDFLGLALLEDKDLFMKAMVPDSACLNQRLTADSLLWQCVQERKYKLYNFSDQSVTMCQQICGCSGGESSDINCLVTIPLFVRQKVIGVLSVGSKQYGAYTDSELRFCQHLADQLAICIENARLYDQVLQGKREWEETFTAIKDPIYLIDLDLNVMRSNNRLLPFINGDKQGDCGHKCYQLLWGINRKCDKCLLEEVISTGKPAHSRKSVSGYVLDVYYYPVFNEQNEIYAVIHHIQDVTEKVKMESQLIQSDKLAAIGEMAAGVAHELNNPMTVIIGTAQLLLREMEKEQPHASYLKDIINGGLRCKRIIQNLLTFSRQEQQPMEPIAVNEQVENVLSLSKYQINRNKISIETDLAENLPLVTANAQQLQQVLLNFLLNARDALDKIDREKYIRISTGLNTTDQGEQQVWLAVEDNGEGIAAENMNKIFNPFYTSKEVSRGTGLGLSVSLGIAQAHGGTIKVISVVGEGSTFKLELPID